MQFRKNVYETKDSFIHGISKETSFYELIEGKQNLYYLKPDEIKDNQIAEYNFVLDKKLQEHEREVTQPNQTHLDDYLDSIAGLYDLILLILTYALQGYLIHITLT